jgi:hypothetical protein
MLCLLGFRQIKGRHSAENMKKFLFYELKYFEIEEKIVLRTTDNGRLKMQQIDLESDLVVMHTL